MNSLSTIQFLSLPLYKRIIYRIINFLLLIPKFILKLFTNKIPNIILSIYKKIKETLNNIYIFFVEGDVKTKISFLIMGFGLLFRKSILRGILYLLFQLVFIIYMLTIGIDSLNKIGSFGYIAQTSYYDELVGLPITLYQDDSFMILLNTIIFSLFILIGIILWYNQIKDSFKLQNLNRIGKTIKDKEIVKSLVGKNYHITMLSLPTIGLFIFTIIPLIFMILVGFTNYSSKFQQPKELFDWVGTYNFQKLFGLTGGSQSNEFAYVFGQILIWTLIWAVFATFTNYFLGMIIAILINKKGIRLKKLWRTILITTIAVPQFISLLFMSKFLSTNDGALNQILLNLGIIKESIKFLEDGLIAKITVIVVNMWVGIPYTMLMCSGILMNIPSDLYESAKIDGANPIKMYMKITLPYMFYITGPYLISTFVSNINNFNVIYLLTGGNPQFTNIKGVLIQSELFNAGQTDLLITWLYKMCMTQVEKDYGVASVIGIFVFVIVATFSLIMYSKTNAVKNEGDFQ